MTPPFPLLDHVVVDVRERVDEAMGCFPALAAHTRPTACVAPALPGLTHGCPVPRTRI
jgi:hypothetical protein